ncbi:hypothetical protein CAOG_07797 [Capsaspora owczarzaki ATCC 30864]|uniref:Uncharacterized protein n=1 Tax=Capsaspora owczarzaki (strain ATCC 30864) TaxID=595528 RepID=A0A0D2W0H1_CAPO3|nr:hypothetical protein CAOG_07797 [Capsaspora owczarzaki ATCC 30864]KJE97692.1 hypothetical protein CAOG_007797 [Capsaspora owczarzaki ATCC 30864]|eukprot:XP_004342870.1 hypothetical protein CAOG_07797 [Capsaspora owczarzaki ATCC 30864]
MTDAATNQPGPSEAVAQCRPPPAAAAAADAELSSVLDQLAIHVYEGDAVNVADKLRILAKLAQDAGLTPSSSGRGWQRRPGTLRWKSRSPEPKPDFTSSLGSETQVVDALPAPAPPAPPAPPKSIESVAVPLLPREIASKLDQATLDVPNSQTAAGTALAALMRVNVPYSLLALALARRSNEAAATQIAEMLIHAGADVRSTAFPTGVAEEPTDSQSLVQLLRASPSAAAELGYGTPLHLACIAGDAHIIRLLVQRGAAGEQCLLLTTKASQPQFVLPLLMELGFSVPHQQLSDTLKSWMRDGQVSGVEALLRRTALNRGQWQRALLDLITSVKSEDAFRIANLIIERAGPSVLNEPIGGSNLPLDACAQSGNEHVALALLQAGAGVNNTTSALPPLIAAIRFGHESTVRVLLAARAFLGPRINGSALQTACFFARPSIVRLLINFGADVNERDDCGLSLLHYCMATGSRGTAADKASMLASLLKCGVNPDWTSHPKRADSLAAADADAASSTTRGSSSSSKLLRRASRLTRV